MRGPKDLAELRAHPRIRAPARAFWLDPAGRTELPVRDVSLGGLFLLAPPQRMQIGDEVPLELGLSDGTLTVRVQAKVVREVVAPQEECGFGLRFVQVSPPIRLQLEALLRQLLAGPGGERRAYPRISHRINVSCTGSREVRALVRDLSLGGAGLWLDTPLAMEERIVMQLHRPSGPPLELNARVVSTRWAMDDEAYDQAGVEFVDLTDAQSAGLREYLIQLLGLASSGN
ncbi:MAG: PilZ domain-containing protein [Myxococcota bacterium]|nr:PilZ domain-containing protein [Myxococcota bacterium]